MGDGQLEWAEATERGLREQRLHPAKDEPGPDEILEALREAILENPRLKEMPSEEVAQQLVLNGRLQEEPLPALVADMLDALEVEEGSFDADELSEEGDTT